MKEILLPLWMKIMVHAYFPFSITFTGIPLGGEAL